MTKLSIIVPVLNEAPLIIRQLRALQPYRERGVELVVVDGGSSDHTVKLSEPLADRVVVAKPGRAHQMNRGAELATGNLLLFLHIDSGLPERAVDFIYAEGESEKPCWGWFDVRLSNPAFIYRVIAACMNRRARLTRVCTGDQALFVSRGLFKEIGGFPEIPLMEDIAISKRLRRSVAPRVGPLRVTASSRRWEKQGILRTVMLMWKLRLLYFLGVSPEKLVARYY
ncbi:MAG: TIGR04283 family arsenosugar biosynthesis glycosyltransferase [Proteobacteria bacterium]|nr:TIGR04283 family arsenosugar biosynthesis glycosyltransferase [Pseudomonadota bacterium]